MGSNRRYAEYYDRQMDRRIVESAMRDHEPFSLGEEERERAIDPILTPERAVPVRAWVHYGKTAISVEAEAVAWNTRCVAIRWRAPDGSVHRAWVWASAVQRR